MHWNILEPAKQTKAGLLGDVDRGIGREFSSAIARYPGELITEKSGRRLTYRGSMGSYRRCAKCVPRPRRRRPCREAQTPMRFGIDVSLRGMQTNTSPNARRRLEAQRQTSETAQSQARDIHEHAGDASGVKPVAHFLFLPDQRHNARIRLRQYDDGRAGILALRRVKSERRRRHVSKPDQRFARDNVVLGGRCVGLHSWIRLRPGAPLATERWWCDRARAATRASGQERSPVLLQSLR